MAGEGARLHPRRMMDRQHVGRLIAGLDYFVVLVYKVVTVGDAIYLGEFEQLVLLAVLRAAQGGATASGVAIARELEQQAGRRVSRGALYTTLDRLEGKGLLRCGSRPAATNAARCHAGPMRSPRAVPKRCGSRSARCSACGAASNKC